MIKPASMPGASFPRNSTWSASRTGKARSTTTSPSPSFPRGRRSKPRSVASTTSPSSVQRRPMRCAPPPEVPAYSFVGHAQHRRGEREFFQGRPSDNESPLPQGLPGKAADFIKVHREYYLPRNSTTAKPNGGTSSRVATTVRYPDNQGYAYTLVSFNGHTSLTQMAAPRR